METLSNAELQDAIRYSTECVKNCLQKSNEYQLHLEQLVALLDKQRRRASERVEYTGTPMTTTLERAEFDARVEAQRRYERTKLSPSEMASLLTEDLFDLCRDQNGPPIRRIEFKSGFNRNGDSEKSHGGLAKEPFEKWIAEWLENWGGRL